MSNEQFTFVLANGDVSITIRVNNILAVHFKGKGTSAEVYLREPDNFTIHVPAKDISSFKIFLDTYWHE